MAMTIRLATAEDSRDLFDWRNDPETCRLSRVTTPVTWEEHEAWLTGALINPDRILMIGILDGMKVGVVRFDRTGNGYEVSITIAPKLRGKGYGQDLLRSAIEALRAQRSFLVLTAEIKPENTASQRLFESLGFQLKGADPARLRYDLLT